MKIYIPKATLSIDEENFLRVLEDSKDFEIAIFSIRKACNIPQNGFPYSSSLSLKRLSRESKTLVAETALRLTNVLNLNSIYWLSTFVNIIVFNTPSAPIKSKHPPLTIETIGSLVKISISEATSTKQIIEFIKANSKILNKRVARLPKAPKMKLENLNVKKQMLQLRKEGKTFKEIAQNLEKDSESLSFQPDYEIVNAELRKYLKYIERLTRRIINL